MRIMGVRGSTILLLSATSSVQAFLPSFPLHNHPLTSAAKSTESPLAYAKGPLHIIKRRLPRCSSSVESDIEDIESSNDDGPEDGVSLRPLEDWAADKAFLISEVKQWLDEEWIPQECHTEVATIAADTYVNAREEGVTDLGQVLLSVGETLEKTDMGDAFVDAWTVANKVSDLLLGRLGREVCCPAPVFTNDQIALMQEGKTVEELKPPTLQRQGSLGGVKLLNPELPPTFFAMEALHTAAERYLDEFNRFDFIRRFLDGHESTWHDANVIMAILLGFRFDEWGNVDASNINIRFSHLTYPPDFRGSNEMREKLEAILMEDEDEDKMKALEEFLEVMVGKAYYHQINKGDDPDFACRATLIKYIYEHDFVNDFAQLPTVKAILEVKGRIDEKNSADQPSNRFLY